MKVNIKEDENGIEVGKTNDVEQGRESHTTMEKLQQLQAIAVYEAVETALLERSPKQSEWTIDGKKNSRTDNPMHSTNHSEISRFSAKPSNVISGTEASDVVFETSNSDVQTDSLSWHRVENSKSSNNDTAYGRTQRITSINSSSTGNPVQILRRAISDVFQNATSAAKMVFSPAYLDFRFKDFRPTLFAKVREMHQISPEDYAASFETTCREKFSEGRSGAFMFYSSDQKCIVKTTTKDEAMTLSELMPAYVRHLEENPNSLIVRFLGCHSIKMYGVELYFVVMLSFFPNSTLSERYDLKGSWVNRHGFNGAPRSINRPVNRQKDDSSTPLFQDNDLQHKFSLEPEVARTLTHQIYKDVCFLRG